MSSRSRLMAEETESDSVRSLRNISDLDFWRSITRSSMVPAAISLMLVTVRVWPMRWARSVAWASAAGFHQGS